MSDTVVVFLGFFFQKTTLRRLFLQAEHGMAKWSCCIFQELNSKHKNVYYMIPKRSSVFFFCFFFHFYSFRSSLSAVFLVKHLGLGCRILIHYCSQRDTRASAGVRSTPVPSVKKCSFCLKLLLSASFYLISTEPSKSNNACSCRPKEMHELKVLDKYFSCKTRACGRFSLMMQNPW